MRRYKQQHLSTRNSGILLPIVGIVAFTALGYFIGDSIQKAHYLEVQKKLELKVENLEQQLEYYRSEENSASFKGEPSLGGQYRLTNQPDPNLRKVSLRRHIWSSSHKPDVSQETAQSAETEVPDKATKYVIVTTER